MKRKDLVTITLCWYKEPYWKLINPLSFKAKDRFSICLGHFAIIIELWFLRGGLEYN